LDILRTNTTSAVRCAWGEEEPRKVLSRLP
jgi:hypothetical protein